MSSENINITRHNYEEYFLLYVDNELSLQERMAVESFISIHPDLAEELDLLKQVTVLEAPREVLGDKSFLMADSMKMNTIDESLFLYLDNELSASEKKKVAADMNRLPAYRFQYEQLLQTKLPLENISYPNKAELYRKTESRPVAYWMRIAAGFILIAALGLIYLLNSGEDKPVDKVAVVPVQTKPEAEQPEKQNIAVVPAESNTEEANPATTQKQQLISPAPGKSQRQIAIQQAPQQQSQQPVVEDPAPVKKPEPKPNEAIAVVQDPSQTIKVIGVTSKPTDPYNPTETVTKPVDDAVAANEKGGSVRGFLRKATRFIEKRTGVNPVNENDELLIGALAIKLK